MWLREEIKEKRKEMKDDTSGEVNKNIKNWTEYEYHYKLH